MMENKYIFRGKEYERLTHSCNKCDLQKVCNDVTVECGIHDYWKEVIPTYKFEVIHNIFIEDLHEIDKRFLDEDIIDVITKDYNLDTIYAHSNNTNLYCILEYKKYLKISIVED